MQTPATNEVIYQSVIAFFFLLVLTRLLGKRHIAQLTFFDYIVGITIGSIAASWSLDEVKTRHALLSLLIWAVLSLVLAFIQKKSYLGRIFLDGRPVVLVQNGEIQEKNLGKAHLSIEEFQLLLRQKDVFKLSDVEYAVFENNGTLSVMKKSEVNPLTPKDAGLSVIPQTETQVLIIDGNVMKKSLENSGYTREWLLGEITKQGAKDVDDVFFAQVDSNGNLYVDLYAIPRKQNRKIMTHEVDYPNRTMIPSYKSATEGTVTAGQEVGSLRTISYLVLPKKTARCIT